MQRYFVEQSILDNEGTIYLTGEQFHHITRVMRMKVGHQVYLVDTNQQTVIAEVTEILSEQVALKQVAVVKEQNELPVEVTLFIGLPKGDKFDLIAQKATELGARYIVPVATRYAVTKWTENKVAKKIARLQKICQQAAEQSHRRIVPEVLPLQSVKKMNEHIGAYHHFIIAYEDVAKEGQHKELRRVYEKLQADEKVAYFFGPEGGLHPEEVQLLNENNVNVHICSLGPRILRAETAPLYALASLSYALEL